MNILIFTEIGESIGYGHVVRCSVLYDLFNENGHNVTFILYGKTKIYEVVGNRKYQFIDWHDENVLNNIKIDSNTISVVDSYSASYKINELISMNSYNTIFIDDNNRMDYPPGIILNPTIYGNEMKNNLIDKKKYFSGVKFILLRKAFFKNENNNIRDNIINILITLGGSNITHLYKEILDTIESIGKNYTINIISPSDIPIGSYINKIRVYKNISAYEVNELMQKSDLAISAGGQTLYELIKVGVPTIVFCLADNQRRNIDYLLKINLIKEVEDFSIDLSKKIKDSSSYSYRYNIHEHCKKLEIGIGVKDLVDWIGEKNEV